MRIISKPPSEQASAAMAPLAVLPVFFGLHGRRAVVIGDSEAAAWKAELLRSAGAEVETAGDWTAGMFAGAALAVADAATDDQAQAFRDAARQAGVPANVIDRPAFSDFQFGSIVNRSPVVIGIATDGAAPILAQAIRRKIETLLPPTLAAWAALARRLRPVVARRLETGPRRRAFWERFVDRAFGPAPTATDETALSAAIGEIAPARGRVTLVGAGPGDAELLTLKAMRALQAADVILFDDLVSDEVLELARREARRILVGKRAGRPSCQQHEISDLMVKLAAQGKHVVRLKSGDPMIFGRAGEEIDRLDQEGIPVDIVPGISAGIALAATLGLSLTHRDFARSVRFVTGHSRHGGLPADLDWQALADPTATTIFYMAGRTSADIAARLMARGMLADTPVVVAANVSRPGQTAWHGDLAGLAVAETSAPVIIGIGRAFGERRRANVMPSSPAAMRLPA
jgi:uroporphyrin-III C-methyltransferase/precorrin-2 dehydrogenase/sirohydrochlorin ferrochelatase